MHMGLSKQLGLPYVGDGNLFQVAPGPALGLQSIAFAPANATYAGNGPQIQSDGKLVTQNTSDSDADYPSRCASDPEVQAAVAKLSTGENQLILKSVLVFGRRKPQISRVSISDVDLYGYPVVHYNSVVGCSTSILMSFTCSLFNNGILAFRPLRPCTRNGHINPRACPERL